jgi:hypothetical protein
LLELPQRVIATARIGIRPAMPDIERAVVSLLEARKAMQNDGHSALPLELKDNAVKEERILRA